MLNKQAAGAGGEIQLTDAINTLGKSQDVYGYRYKGIRYDCGNLAGFIAANAAYALRRKVVGAEVKEILKRMVAE